MLEIDMVRSAIESWHPFEITDEVSDLYLKVIDLATTPNPTPAQSSQLSYSRLMLSLEEASILHCLAARDDWFEEGSLVSAFISSLRQIDTITAGQQGSNTVE